MPIKNKFELGNVVVIGDRSKGIEKYEHAILLRMAPIVYNKPEHQCIIIKVIDHLLEFSEKILKNVKWAGLQEVSRQRKELKNEKEGYTLPDAWEIKLKKRAVLEMDENE